MINYVVIKRKSPVDLENRDLDRWYAMQKVFNTEQLDEVCRKVALRSSMSEGDVLSVVTNWVRIVESFLKDGKTVCLGRVGKLRVQCSSRGAGTKELLTTRYIKGFHIVYTPGVDFKNTIAKSSVNKLPESAWPIPKF